MNNQNDSAGSTSIGVTSDGSPRPEDDPYFLALVRKWRQEQEDEGRYIYHHSRGRELEHEYHPPKEEETPKPEPSLPQPAVNPSLEDYQRLRASDAAETHAVRQDLKRRQDADSDEAGHPFRSIVGHLFRFHSGRPFDLKPATSGVILGRFG